MGGLLINCSALCRRHHCLLQACKAARAWANYADAETAEFAGELDALLASCHQVAGQLGEVSRALPLCALCLGLGPCLRLGL